MKSTITPIAMGIVLLAKAARRANRPGDIALRTCWRRALSFFFFSATYALSCLRFS
jgi:hypothetical protein